MSVCVYSLFLGSVSSIGWCDVRFVRTKKVFTCDLILVLLLVNCDDINEWPFCSYIIVRRTKSASNVYSGVRLILLFSTVIILNDWLRLDYIQQIACTISQRVPLKYFVRSLNPQLISHRYPVHVDRHPTSRWMVDLTSSSQLVGNIQNTTFIIWMSQYTFRWKHNEKKCP